MDNIQGNRSLAEAAPFRVSTSRSSETHLRHLYHSLLPLNVSPETFVQNPSEGIRFDETLETSFSRLNVSPNNLHPPYPGFDGDISDGLIRPVNDYGIRRHGFLSLPFLERGQTNVGLRNLNMQNSDVSFSTAGSVGFQDYGRNGMPDGSGIDIWENSGPGFHSTSNFREPSLNQNGFSSDLTRLSGREVSTGHSITPHYNRNGFVGGCGGDECGGVNCLVSKTQNSLSSYSYNRLPQGPLNFLRMKDLRGHILALAKDRYGGELLRTTLDGKTTEEMDMIFLEVKDHLVELMLDPSGNFVFQKLVEVCSEEQRTQILLKVTKNVHQLVRICLNMHGTRAVQKLLERLTTRRQISLIISALGPVAVTLIKDMDGNHVIRHCLKHFSYEDNRYLLNVVADNCVQIARDRSGCCVLQQCVEYSLGEQRERLVAEIIANALLLAEDCYGNYVVQHILGLKVPQIMENLLRQFEGYYASLARNKYGSNVVEKCLIESGEQQSTRIILELLGSPDVSMLFVDPFGNYVMQSALLVSKGPVFDELLNLVRINSPMMRSNLYGRKVLTWLERRKLLHI